MNKKEREDLVEDILKRTAKRFGENALVRIGNEIKPVPSISTGSMRIDKATGIGGVPRGRLSIFWGKEGSGKTTLALQVAANAQKEGDLVAYIDMENALDPENCVALGVNLDDMLIAQPENGETAMSIVESLAISGECGLIVIDSLATLLTRAEINAEIGDSVVASKARMLSQAFAKINPRLSKYTALIAINQVRSNISTFGYGDPDTMPGGMAAKYCSGLTIKLKPFGKIKNGEEIIGNKTRVVVEKSKVGAPYRHCEAELIFGKGFQKSRELLDMAVERDIIVKGGAWYTYGEHKWQGKENVLQFLDDNPEVAEKLEADILKEQD